MFLGLTKRRNPNLIQAAVKLHQEGLIPANTYLIDLDTVIENARALGKEARTNKVNVYFMTKQFNRNPLVGHAILRAGLKSAVAVDVQCAKSLHRYGIPVGHVGHLVQIPKHEVPNVLEMRPEVWTVFSIDKAREISEAAQASGCIQKILLRVRAPEDIIYPNEEGGIWEEEIDEVVDQILAMDGVKIVGTVTFPGTLFSENKRVGCCTINTETAIRVARRLEKKGLEIEQINIPGASSAAMLRVVRDGGGTHAEPGHALTGTTPWHLFEDLVERPAMVYVNEISHTFENRAYCFGGGFYACDTPANRGDDTQYRQSSPWVPHAYVSNAPQKIFDHEYLVDVGSFFGRTLNATDYYGGIMVSEKRTVKTGDTAVFGFRAQVFTTRSYVAVIRDVTSNPRVVGIFDRANNLLDRKGYPATGSVAEVQNLINEELGC